MTHEQMNDFIQDYCPGCDCGCLVYDICTSVHGAFMDNYDACKKAYEILVSQKKDSVNHPAHYESGKYECIDVMAEAIGLEDTKGFCLCNAFKYIFRCTKKHTTPVEDVKKAIWYLQKFLELEGEADG